MCHLAWTPVLCVWKRVALLLLKVTIHFFFSFCLNFTLRELADILFSYTGCHHEFCTRCALYLCTTNSASSIAPGPPGAIPCPLCRAPIISFTTLATASPIRNMPRRSLSLTLCATCPSVSSDSPALSAHLCRSESQCSSSSHLRQTSCHPSMVLNLNPVFCMGVPGMIPCMSRCTRPGTSLRRSTSQLETGRSSWPFAFNQITAAAGSS